MFNGANTIKNKETSDYINIKHFILNIVSLYVIVTSRSSTAKSIIRLEIV